jgi:hypothetical protein
VTAMGCRYSTGRATGARTAGCVPVRLDLLELGTAVISGANQSSIARCCETRHCLKSKDREHPAVRREAEEDWAKQRWR